MDFVEMPAGAERPDPSDARLPEQLADDLEAMGPAYVKLGQVLSSRSDLLPEPYLKALARLQDDVKGFPYEEVEEIVSRELGVKISKAFSRFDRDPLAAASLGQVHRAALRDGREVVVKVQRPGIREQIAEDFAVLKEIAAFSDKHTEAGRRYRFGMILEEFRLTILQELDYEREAQNLVTLGNDLAEYPSIVVPQPVSGYSTGVVLTMDYVRGAKLTTLGPVARLDIDGRALADQLFQAYLKQVLIGGVFHADPHPGNVLVTDEGRIALIDMGMVGRTTPAMQDQLVKLLVAMSSRDSERIVDIVIALSDVPDADQIDRGELRRRIAHIVLAHDQRPVNKIDVGRSLLDVSRAAAECGVFVPAELTLLAKTLLQLEEIAKALDPTFDADAAIKEHVSEIVARRMTAGSTGRTFMASLLEAKEFFSGLPSKLNKVMDTVSNHELEVRVKVVDSTVMLEGFQKIANRITTGIVLAALIIGASLLMRVETRFRLFGYPGLAMLCFLAAAAGGAYLVLSIFAQDRARLRR